MSKSRFESHWLVLPLLLLLTLVMTAFINFSHTNNDATKIEGTIRVDNGDQKINWNHLNTTYIELRDSLEITQSGVYRLSGILSDGLISINVGKDGVVKLIFDNVSITNANGPAIVCYSADDLVIELVGQNTIKDGSSYSSNLDEDIKGTIYSKADLTFTGNGKLTIEANYEDGIISKDDLKFASGTYQIIAKDDAIRGKDSVYIISGTFDIEAGSDGIKATNEIDLGKGFVLIENGIFNFTTTAKGINAINSILIYDGNFHIDSYDDAIHSNNYVGIIDGVIKIASGDDGIHADRELIVDGGNIAITKSYEGFEAQKVTINNGKISIVSSDDGINAGGGSDGSATNRPGAGPFDVNENCVITINGGDISINASGDGIDSNGAIYFNGGKVIIDGPTNNGNGALDAGLEAYIYGGEVVAVGSSGMAVALSSGSSVFNLSIYFSSTYKAGAIITLKNSSGRTIVSHTAQKSFNHIVIGSNRLIAGETYTLYVDGTVYQTFTITNITTILGKSTNNFNNNFRR